MNLVMLIPNGSCLKRWFEEIIGGWAEAHGMSLEIYQDKAQTWERLASLPPGSIFVTDFWDLSPDGVWDDQKVTEIMQILIQTLPQTAGAVLFDTLPGSGTKEVERQIVLNSCSGRIILIQPGSCEKKEDLFEGIRACLAAS